MVHAHHVLEYEYLAVDATAGSDADHRHTHQRRHPLRQLRRHLLKHNGEAAELVEQPGVLLKLAGLGLLLGAHAVGAELVDRLRRQAEMSHHRDTGRQYALYRLADLRAPFELHGLGSGLLHDTHGRCQRLHGVALIRAERQIHHHKRALCRAGDALGIGDHLVESDRERGEVSGHYVGGRVAHQYEIHTGLVDQRRYGEII